MNGFWGVARGLGCESRRRLPAGLAALLAAAACLTCGPARGQAPVHGPVGRDPQLDVAIMLVRNALAAVNQGNITGNYTVLRDLGAPAFRDRNSAAQLAAIFQRIRDQKADLSPTLLLEPVFTEAPGLNQAGQLQLVGFFPTQPLQVQFRLAYQRVGAGWMFDTVSIGTAPAQPPLQNMGSSIAQPADGGLANAAGQPVPPGYTR